MIWMIWLCACVRYWPGRGSVSLALIDCLIYFTDKPMAVKTRRSTFSAHAVGELLCGSQPTATTCVLWSVRLKGHSHLVHMRIRYHFLADLHIPLHPQVSHREAHPLKNLNKPCRVEVFASQNYCGDYRPNVILKHSFS